MMNPLEMIRNLQNVQAQAEEVRKKVAQLRCTGYALGNMIEVVVTGDMRIESMKIDPSVIKEGQEGMLEVLIASAVNSAFDSIKERIAEEARQVGAQYGIGI